MMEELSPRRQLEIATKISAYLLDLLQLVEGQIKEVLDKAKNAWLWPHHRKEEAMQEAKEKRSLIGPVLSRAYAIISQG